MSTQLGNGTVIYPDGSIQHTSPIQQKSVTPIPIGGNTMYGITSIPPYTTKVTITFWNVTTNGTSPIIIRISESNYPYTSGYSSMGSTNWISMTTSAGLLTMQATNTGLSNDGVYTLAYMGGGISGWSDWDFSGTTAQCPSFVGTGQGAMSIYGPLGSIWVTTLNGTDQFLGGSYVNFTFEGS